MKPIEELVEEIKESEGVPGELLDELFWASLARGLASGTSAWGRLFADIRGWSKAGGDNAGKQEQRLTEAEAADLVKKVFSME
jgi:hypothetical protein